MALSSVYNNHWFNHWQPPPELFASSPYQNVGDQHLVEDHERLNSLVSANTNPYRAYSINHLSHLTPSLPVLGGKVQKYPGLQGSQEKVIRGHNPFSGESISYIQNPDGTYSNWNVPGIAEQPIIKDNGQISSVAQFLPTLLRLGMIGGLAADSTGLRGDQDPPGDPDRDLDTSAPFRTLYHWNLIDFQYESSGTRKAAIDSKDFIPLNTLPLGLETWKDRVFVTFPRWKAGVPCTLATAPRVPSSSAVDHSPKLKPYPSWNWHRQQGDCSGLTSVFRISADRCGRLWVLDSGQVETLAVPKQVCPPQLFVFNLTSDEVIGRYPIPEEHVRENSLFTNIITDIRDDKCEDVHAYFTDVWRFSIIVFRLKDEKFWRFNSHLFYPDPLASDYNLHGINFQWSDGIFGISLTPVNKRKDRMFFFHPMSSYREFVIPASVLRNETAVNDTALLAKEIKLAGESRGYSGQSSASAIDRNGVMFFNLVTRDSVGCWDTRKPYKKSTLGVVAKDSERLVFPNDLKIDNEERQSVWVLSNKLPVFLYRELNPKEINFRIMREYVDEAVAGGICDSRLQYTGPHDYEPECY